MESNIINVNCISGNTYTAFEVKNTRQLPKSAELHECGHEFEDGNLGRTFNIYKSITSKRIKYFIKFDNYFKNNP